MRASSAAGGRFSTRSARSCEELLGAQAPGVVGLRQREDLLELVEDQQRQHGAAARIAQQVAAVVQELPQRLAFDRRARPRPVAGGGRGPEDRLLDLFRRRRRIGRVVDPHVDRADSPRRAAAARGRRAAAKSCRGPTGRTAPSAACAARGARARRLPRRGRGNRRAFPRSTRTGPSHGFSGSIVIAVDSRPAGFHERRALKRSCSRPQELRRRLATRQARDVHGLELLGHQRLGFGRVVDAHRQDEHGALGDVARAVDRVTPLAPEIGLVPALRRRRDHRQEEAAARDVGVDLAVVIVAAFEPVEVEPGRSGRRRPSRP